MESNSFLDLLGTITRRLSEAHQRALDTATAELLEKNQSLSSELARLREKCKRNSSLKKHSVQEIPYSSQDSRQSAENELHAAPSLYGTETSSDSGKSALSDCEPTQPPEKELNPQPPPMTAPFLKQRRKSLELPKKNSNGGMANGDPGSPTILRRKSFDGIPGIVLDSSDTVLQDLENSRRQSNASVLSKLSKPRLQQADMILDMQETASVNTARLSRSSRRSCTRNGVTELWPVWKEGMASMKFGGVSCSSDQMRRVNSLISAPSSKNMAHPSKSVSSQGTFGGKATFLVTGAHFQSKKWMSAILRTILLSLLSPNSAFHLGWDTLGLLVIVYDLLEIPFRVFDPPESWFSSAMAFIIAIFWTLDMALCFVQGYQKDGVIITDPKKVIVNYVRTWFLYDFIVVTADWMSLLFTQLGFSKLLRVARTIRLLRLLKVGGLLQETSKYIQSEYVLTLFGVAKLLACILIVNHLIACAWYGIGTSWYQDERESWVVQNDLADATILYSYSTALHWSLTQFTPASMEVVPQNVSERVFTVFVLLFAMVTFSSFVSSITNAMTHLRRLNSQRLAQHAALRQFLREHRVSSKLVGRIWTCVRKNRDASKSSIHRKDVAILITLPKHVQNDLLSEIYVPVLTRHPFFGQYVLVNPSVVRRMARELDELSIGIGAEVFCEGDAAESMFFIRKGLANYKYSAPCLTTCTDDEDVDILKEGSWVCEPVLWVRWIHKGTMAASEPCELVVLRAKIFQDLAAQHLHEHPQPAMYADMFWRHFFNDDEQVGSHTSGDSEVPLLTDTWADPERLQTFTLSAFMAIPDEANGQTSRDSGYFSQEDCDTIAHAQPNRERRSSFGMLFPALPG